MSLVLIIAGILLIFNGAFLSIMSNITTGIVLTIILGAVLLIYGIKFCEINRITGKGIPKIIKYIVLTGIGVEIILAGFIAVYGQVDNADYNEDAVVVLGAGVIGDRVSLPLKLRLDKAVDYHRKNPESVICVTGGMGFQESVTEAYAMEKYLISRGIDKDVIIKEEKATSTVENMRYSKEILDGFFEDDYRIVVITNGFHIYRGVSTARAEGFENVSHIHAGLQWYNLIPCYIRESLAVVKMWVLAER